MLCRRERCLERRAILGSTSDAWWWKQFLIRKANFCRVNDPAKTKVSTFLRRSSKHYFDPRATLRNENEVWRREKRNSGQKAMRDDGSDAWFEKRIFWRANDLAKAQDSNSFTILSGSMVRAKRRGIRRCLHRAAMLGDEIGEGEERYDVRRVTRVKSDP